MVLINILTRTGKRPKLFKKLEDSIISQTYKNIRHIKSCDNPACNYLNNSKDVIKVVPDKSAGKAFYNLYLNTLLDVINGGWIIILDDDSKLIDNNFLEALANECRTSNKNDVLIYKVKIHKGGEVLPKDNSVKYGKIDMACFCFHSSISKDLRFDGRPYGDFNFLDKIRNSNNYNFKFLNGKKNDKEIPIGIWANYEGPKHGK
jgi:hypothetical protein